VQTKANVQKLAGRARRIAVVLTNNKQEVAQRKLNELDG